MTEHERTVLLAILRLEEAHKATKPPDPHRYFGPARVAAGERAAAWHDAAAHGPRIADMHTSDAERKRNGRALRQLEAAGLVELWGPGVNVTRCRLTTAGEAAARGLPAAPGAGQADDPAGDKG
jgi:hypothetical protein